MARKKKKHEWKLIYNYDVTNYQCGLEAGDVVRLKKDLHTSRGDGTPTGIYPAGQIWRVLSGASEDPGVVWFRRPDGDRHTWDDDASSVFEWFEKVEPFDGDDKVP
jgi:hypothetical protein